MLKKEDRILGSVIPAKAGIQRVSFTAQKGKNWMPAFAGMTGRVYAEI
ncbi:MAG: hypothetical protein SFX19_05720 [Alphaproteobacteria bacterium]|nr:hypothetical protein [Alphaproteobacteria bacterium]